MVNLFDLISNKVGNVGNKVGSFYKNLITPNAPTLPVIQLADNGEIDYQKSFDETQKQPRGMWEHLTGRTITMDADSTDPETGEITTQRIAKFQPGFFNNLVSGAKENFATGFAAPNLTDNTGEFGKKSASYRLGEGIGTLGRFLESPLGRGLLVGGIVGASGGSGLEALGYGAGTTMGNQGNRMRDRAYRDDLIGSGKQAVMNSPEFKAINDPMARQAMLDNVENRVNSYRGYITDDVYRNMIDSQIAQENAAYRRMYYDNQAKQDEFLGNLNREKFEYQKQQDKIDNAQEWAKINASENRANSKDDAKRKQSLSTLNMIDTALGVVANNPKAYGFWKGVAPNDVTNRADAEGVKARAVIDSVTAEYRKYLTGAQMSDKERKDYEKFLPNPRDNADIIRRKLQGMQMVIQAREGLFDYVADNTTPSINVDTNALEAEMRKRGLK